MQAALLEGSDDQAIATLRNQVINAVDSSGIEFDDTIHVTPAARAAAPAIAAKLKASQRLLLSSPFTRMKSSIPRRP